ncbi:GumC family protein [Flavobacterium ardleyense]|uniref:GumC family protein n=1 Tax=Flavobacterium ardleyense TaxID=2038737 RepID=UPI00298D220C|nr:polysaccharide biosynthesis tyrosine autokinase [Flavobacterium ardleyense]
MQNQNSVNNQEEEESINIAEMAQQYLYHWKWFVVSVVLFIVAAFMYIRYTTPIYKATATILVKDDRKGGLQSELSAFSDLGLMGGVKSNVDNEIEIIKSRTIVEKAVRALDYNISYFTEGTVRTMELYAKKPVSITFIERKPEFYTDLHSFQIRSKTDSQFELLTTEGSTLGVFTYGKIIDLSYTKMIVVSATTADKDYSMTVVINKLNSVVQGYKGAISIATVGKNTSVVELSITNPVREKAEAIIDEIVNQYNQDAIEDKNFISRSTEKFISGRLEIISKELGDVEKTAEGFKESNQITDVVANAGVYLQNSVVFEKELIEAETKLRIVSSMMEFLKSNKNQLIPSNIIPDEGSALELIAEHNQAMLERDRISKNSTDRNSVVINLNNRIEDLRLNIIESLSRLTAAIRIKKSELERQVNTTAGKISQIPGQERQFRIIDRQQKIKETLYLYLLQKREETALALAATEPNAKVIDSAVAANSPISPKKNIIFLGALFLGMLIPFAIIYLIDLLDTKVKSRLDVEKLNIPFLGDIPTSESHEEIINANSRSSSAEAIRIVRTNLEFMLTEVPEGRAKTVFITSTLPKEGKTFVTANLASTIALSDKKVLLIGLDIRNPKLTSYYDMPSKGITNYLAQSESPIGDYIAKIAGYDNLYVLPPGAIPPNPVELLLNKRVDSMFEELKREFDYIVVDTAPVSVVTDTLLIAKNADAFVYVVRANYLEKRLLKVMETFYKDGKLPNMSVILNDSDWTKSFGYGYGYGYGYGQDIATKNWWQKLLKK